MRIGVNGSSAWFDVDGPVLIPDGPGMRQRPTIVLLHGGPGYDHTYLKPDFGRLAKLAQVVYLDHRGLGRSEQTDPSHWNFEILADDLRAFCDALGIVKPIVLGHSMGGFVAMLYASRYPGHPGALILQSTSAKFDLDRLIRDFRRLGGDEVGDIARRFYEGDSTVTMEEWARCRVLFGPWVPGEEERARTILHSELGPTGLRLIRNWNAIECLSQIACATLVCVGSRDPVSTPEDSRTIVESLPKGCARLEIIEGAGHFPWKDAPERYWNTLEEFVAEVANFHSGIQLPLPSA